MSISKIHSGSLQCEKSFLSPERKYFQSSKLKSYAAYYPAVLKFCPNQALGWHIEYYARANSTSKLVRYRIRLNSVKRRYRLMSEFYEYSNMLVEEINIKLSQGWSPDAEKAEEATNSSSVPNTLMTTPASFAPTSFVPTPSSTHTYVSMINELQKEVEFLKNMVAQSSSAQATPEQTNEIAAAEPANAVEVDFVPAVTSPAEDTSVADIPICNKGITLVELVDRFLQAKEKVVRKDTMRSYSNYAKLFKTYLEEYLPGVAAQDFSRADAQAYMAFREEEIAKVKAKRGDTTDTSARTINNHIKAHRLFFAWGIEEELVTNNPFAQLKLQRNEEKRRDLVTDSALIKIKEHLTNTDQRGFLLVCMLIYSGFIRPKEIRELRIKDIHLKDHCIIVPPEVSKNHCSRVVGLTPEIEALILSLHMDVLPLNYYICGKDLGPNAEPAPAASYSKAWLNVRRELSLPETMQLYSLKDTGITTMLENGVPAIDVMKQAGHHDLSITTRYANHRDTRIAQKMYNTNLSFGSKPDNE